MATELIITNPHGDMDTVARWRREIMDRQEASVAEIEAETASLDGTNYRSHKLNAFDAHAKALTDAGKKLADAIAQETGAAGILVQIAASAKAVKVATEAYQTRLRELKAENEPAAPSHTYFYAVTATDAQHVALQKQIAKVDEGFGCVAPQKDAEWRTAAKLFGIKEEK